MHARPHPSKHPPAISLRGRTRQERQPPRRGFGLAPNRGTDPLTPQQPTDSPPAEGMSVTERGRARPDPASRCFRTASFGWKHPKPDVRTLTNTTQRPTARITTGNSVACTGRPPDPPGGPGSGCRQPTECCGSAPWCETDALASRQVGPPAAASACDKRSAGGSYGRRTTRSHIGLLVAGARAVGGLGGYVVATVGGTVVNGQPRSLVGVTVVNGQNVTVSGGSVGVGVGRGVVVWGW